MKYIFLLTNITIKLLVDLIIVKSSTWLKVMTALNLM